MQSVHGSLWIVFAMFCYTFNSFGYVLLCIATLLLVFDVVATFCYVFATPCNALARFCHLLLCLCYFVGFSDQERSKVDMKVREGIRSTGKIFCKRIFK